jgi:diguanylate cyclase (GGDEF)-like protein/PAS domain S-box-containing protein
MESGYSAPPLQQEFSYRRLVESSTTALLVLVDLAGRIVYLNPASRWLLGYEPEELIGHPCDELIPEGLAADAMETFRRAREGHPHLQQRILARRKDGRHVHLRFDATPMIDAEGEVEAVVVTAHDIEEELASRPHGRSSDVSADDDGELIERLPAVVYVAEPGERGEWSYVSPQVEHMLGYSPEEWLADPGLWASRIHPDDRPRVLQEEDRDSARSAPVGSEYRMLTRDGRIIWVRDEAVMRLKPDGSSRYDGLLIDITERKRYESQLRFFAEHDSLTQLFNRRRFLADLETELKRRRRYDHPASLLMIDLDDLKEVNDSLGHRVGDDLIRATAELLTSRLRDSDTVARLGGDEFAVLLRGTDLVHANVVAEEILEMIRARARLLTGGLTATGASVGVAELRRRFQTPEDALAKADAAMYEAKRMGGGRVQTVPGADE